MTEAKLPKPERKNQLGCWAVINGVTGEVTLYNGEMKALRAAVAIGATVEFVKWGSPIVPTNPPMSTKLDASDGSGF